MTKQKEQELKNIIYEAAPDIRARNTSVIIGKPFSGIINYRDDVIRLGDVLTAFKKKGLDILIDNEGTFCKREEGKHKTKMGEEDAIYPMGWKQNWNLEETFDNQSTQLKTFFYNLLVKK